jgi:hypothetical protein
MKLRAKIKRIEDRTHRTIHFYIPAGVRPVISESIITRNIGPRPWTEAFGGAKDGSVHRMYSARKSYGSKTPRGLWKQEVW